MNTRKFLILALLPIIFALLGCNSNSVTLKPSISGKAGEVIVVTKKVFWESAPGTQLRSVLAKDYPYLPQREPSFTLINIGDKDFSKIFQIHRNIVALKIDHQYTEPKIVTQLDVWSAPQTVITITAPNQEVATNFIKENEELLFNTLEQSERNRVIRNSKRYEEASLRKQVNQKFGGSPFFPKGYTLKKETNDFIWISYETTYTNQGIFIYKIPYKDSTSMSIENLIKERDDILQRNVPGMLENSYMITNTMEDQYPQQKWVKYKEREFSEIRGFWEVQNDFMGGPFVSHAFYDKNSSDIIVTEAFVYAPRFDKRNYVRQVESILYSFEWEETEKKQ